MLLLSSADLFYLADPTSLIRYIERGLLFPTGKAPKRQHLSTEDSVLLVMPAADKDFFGVKLVTVTPNNRVTTTPVVQGALMLIDAHSGSPVALLDAAALTCQRTGAVAAIGISRLRRIEDDSIGLIGCGVQGCWAVISSNAINRVSRLYCFEPSESSFDSFKKALAEAAPSLGINRCGSADIVVRSTNTIICATTSEEPVITNSVSELRERSFVSLGSYRPDMQELPDAVYRLARHVIVDSPDASEEVGDLINTLSNSSLHQDQIIALSEAIRLGDDAPQATVFKSVGHASFDILAATFFFRKAMAAAVGTKFALA